MSRWKELWKKEEEKEERFILCLDGGGIRGLIPSRILETLSSQLKKLGDRRPLYSHFDLIGGTSTGSLLALGLSLSGLNARQEEGNLDLEVYGEMKKLFTRKDYLLGRMKTTTDPSAFAELYLNNASKIFSSRHLGRHFLDTKYDPSSLENFLSSSFGEAKLEEALVPTFVVSYDALSGKEVILSSYNEWKSFEAARAARASTAAPIYFSPYYTLSPEGKQLALLDGGLIANNPSLIAYREARKLYPSCKCFHILSLGTAKSAYTFNPKELSGGMAGWGEPMMKIYPSSQMSVVDDVLSGFDDVAYTRLDGKLKKRIRLDATSMESMQALLSAADDIIQNNRDSFDAFAEKLARRKDFTQVKLETPTKLPAP